MTVLIQILTLNMSHTTNLDDLEAIEVLKMTSGLNISKKKIKKSKLKEIRTHARHKIYIFGPTLCLSLHDDCIEILGQITIQFINIYSDISH